MVAAASLDISLVQKISQAFSDKAPNVTSVHYKEWEESAVDPEIIALNVISLFGDEIYQYVIPDPEATTKRVHPDAQWRNLRTRYGHLENGGWWVSGIDPLNGYTQMQWGSFKPDTPRNKRNGFGAIENKKIKYEHPANVPMRAIFLQVPQHIWEKISKRYGIPMPPSTKNNINIYSDSVDVYTPSISFWQWVYENNIPISIVEGAKKAGALLTAGFVAIAIPGIFAGYRSSRDSAGKILERALIPELQHFATPGREINICFDYEDRPIQMRDMGAAITGLYYLLLEKGCEPRITALPGKEKGVDDFIAARGADIYEKIHAKLTVAQWTAQGLSGLNDVSVTINQRYLGDMQLPPGAKLVAIKSPKGTGKTKSLIKIVAERMRAGLPTLLITHRIQLGEAICTDIGLDYVSKVNDGNRSYFGFGLCVDSLHPQCKAQFNAEDWKDALVIVDECEQVFWHLLAASTEIKKHRTEVIAQLEILFRNALTSNEGGVILLDADLSNLSIELVLGLAEIDIKPWVVLNEWKPEKGRHVTHYEESIDMLLTLESKIRQGEKVFVVTQSQKAKSKFGTINLETRWRQKFPELRILRIDSDTVSQFGHPALGCIPYLNEILWQYDIVICSPSIETGVSIDIEGHFDSIWAFFQGVSTVNSACQSVARVRELIPLHVFAKERGLSFAGNQSLNYKTLKDGQNYTFRSSLTLINFDEKDVCTCNATALNIWGKMAARVNCGMTDYRASILAALEAEGHTVEEANPNNFAFVETEGGTVEASKELKATKEENHIAQCVEVAEQDVSEMTHTEYEALQAKKVKTPHERNIERKYELSQRYQVDVTPDLVAADDNGLYPALRLQYYLTVGRPHLLERDKKVVEKMLSGTGELFIPDVNKSTLGAPVATLEFLGIPALLAQTGREFRGNDSDMQTLLTQALQYRNQIKDLLGITISKKAEPIKVLRQLLKKLGLKLRVGGRDSSGVRQRFYFIKSPLDEREEIFSKWLSKDDASNAGL
jgi:Domain of unknown function (DUF3854)